jgi:hypothetical protein
VLDAGALAEAVSVSVDEPPAVTVVGENAAVTPAGRPEIDSAIDCAAPDRMAVVTVVVEDAPDASEMLVGERLNEKSSGA